jgi:hypothetical protein
MTPSRQAAPLALALLLLQAAACGTRTSHSVPDTSSLPSAQYRRMLDAAASARREGRVEDAIHAYEAVARAAGEPSLVRTASLQAGLLRVAAEPPVRDLAAARSWLQQARAMYASPEVPPLALRAVLPLLARLETAEHLARSAGTASARAIADRDQEIRSLRRTVAMLQQQVQKKDEALKKAAEAAVGPAPRAGIRR